MNKLHGFLYADGALLALGTIFFGYLLLRRVNGSQFRDDLWAEEWKKKERKRQREEDRRDQKILRAELAELLEDGEEEEKTQPRLGAPAAASGGHRAADRAADRATKRSGPRPGPASKPTGSTEFRTPKFRGAPHEVLGIPAAADEALIGRAHKYWIKRYHPDRVNHLGASYVEQARQRSEELNGAREAMLRARKK